MNCDFRRDGNYMVCAREGCRRRVPILVPGLDPARCVATCRVADDGSVRPRARVARGRACVHLGAATGAVALVHCHACRGNVRKKHAVHLCALHGECLPTAPAAATGVLPMKCALCGHNPANQKRLQHD